MKKIVALVLCLVLALSLCTVAMAAPVDVANAKVYTLATTVGGTDTDVGPVVVKKSAAVPVKYTREGKLDAAGTLEYYVISGSAYAVVAKTEATHKIVDGLNEIYVKADATVTGGYVGVATEFTAFSSNNTCGGVVNTGVKHYTWNDADGTVHIAPAGTGRNVLVDGKIVAVDANDAAKVAHGWEGKDKNAAGTAYTTAQCKYCKVVATIYNNKTSVPAGLTTEDGTGIFAGKILGYGAAAGTTTVESAKTFDAGIALYAGMALASVAGSAVVIGKKKEF